MANKDQFDLDIQVKSVNYSAQATDGAFNSQGCATQSCHQHDYMRTAFCTVTLSCKCY